LTNTQTDDTAEDWIVLAEHDRTRGEDEAHERCSGHPRRATPSRGDRDGERAEDARARTRPGTSDDEARADHCSKYCIEYSELSWRSVREHAAECAEQHHHDQRSLTPLNHTNWPFR
jgi:hypothetical protein